MQRPETETAQQRRFTITCTQKTTTTTFARWVWLRNSAPEPNFRVLLPVPQNKLTISIDMRKQTAREGFGDTNIEDLEQDKAKPSSRSSQGIPRDNGTQQIEERGRFVPEGCGYGAFRALNHPVVKHLRETDSLQGSFQRHVRSRWLACASRWSENTEQADQIRKIDRVWAIK